MVTRFFWESYNVEGIKDMGTGSNPVFLGGYEEGIEVNWISNMHYPNYAAIGRCRLYF